MMNLFELLYHWREFFNLLVNVATGSIDEGSKESHRLRRQRYRGKL